MSSESPVNVAIKFVERFNRRDFDGLVELMSPDHRLLPGGKEVLIGPARARGALSGYVSSWPEFQIHISDVHLIGNTVILVARTTGSCVQLPRGDEIRKRRIYVASVADGLVDKFRYYEEDTSQLREALGMTSASRVTT